MTTVIADLHAYTVLRSTLAASANIVTALTQDGILKVFADWVDASIPMPYVVMKMYAGGNDNDALTDAATPLIKVSVFGEDQAEVVTIREYIHAALHMQDPVNTDLPVGVEAYDVILEKYAYSDTYLRENHPIFEKGGIYEVKLAVCKI